MIVILALAVAVIFAIMGMSLFKGRFASCTDSTLEYPMGRLECSGNNVNLNDGLYRPTAWLTPEENFDTFTRAMMQCLTMNTMQWTFLARTSADVTEPGKALATDKNVQNIFFLVIYLIIGGLFVTNLFVRIHFSNMNCLNLMFRLVTDLCKCCCTYFLKLLLRRLLSLSTDLIN